jgi:hypothetical protein
MKVAHIESTSMNTQLEVHAYLTRTLHAKVGLLTSPQDYPIVTVSIDPVSCPEIREYLNKGEFAIFVGDSDRAVLKELKEAYIFTDTGKRVCFNQHWYEVWRLRPEHLTLIEKESNDGTPQGQH